ncbi:hypothetical protein [Ligilactobacillus equi]|uniref:hypothetical protein n=1 Tax=Ligilactobacillus equi TaxID=137357 RepID=UPI00041FDC61|nr:hypothetical protein [Ligilactobacillus equi]
MDFINGLLFDSFVANPAAMDIFNNFQRNVANSIADPIIKAIGAVAFIFGSWAILRYLMGQQQGGAHWVLWFVALIFGALFYLNGLSGWTSLGGTTTDTVNGLFQAVTPVATIATNTLLSFVGL